MKFAVSCELLQDAPTLVQFAVDAERAGWDGFFIWDTVVFSVDEVFPVADPWVVLGAIAANTSRIRIGTMVTGVPRRRPWVLARQTVSVDRISNGRLTLGVGLGEGPDLENFGEETDLKVRARRLDEGLDLITKLWSGERVDHHGEYFKADGVTFLPRPTQLPRIPIWTGGYWPNKAPFRRAAQWDGMYPLSVEDGKLFMTPDLLRQALAYVMEHRMVKAHFDVVGSGVTDPSKEREAGELVREYEAAGATWFFEDIDHYTATLQGMAERIRRGPPKAGLPA